MYIGYWTLNKYYYYYYINTSRSIAFCNCASIIIILKCLFYIIYSLHAGLSNILRLFRSLMCALLIMWKCCIYHNYIINKAWVNLLYDHIYYSMCIACVHCSYIERQLYVYNNEKNSACTFYYVDIKSTSNILDSQVYEKY